MADDETIEAFARDALVEDGEQDVADFLSEGEGDDLDDLEAPVPMNTSFPNAVFVCNVPSVSREKYDKLMGVLKKLVDKYGPNERYMPLNEETQMTDGFVIVTYEKPECADEAVKTMNGFQLDKNHVFKVVKFDQFDHIVNRSDNFVPNHTLTTFSRSDFRDWLLDKKCREQFLIRYQQETEIYWHDTAIGRPVKQYGGEREKEQKKIWCDWKVQWSPQGSYVVTFHQQGVALWAGPEFTKKQRFPHASAKYVEFSPTEEFILTWNGAHASDKDAASNSAVCIFRVLTGECVRKCRTPAVLPLGDEHPNQYFLWSFDGKYVAECGEAKIYVRDTETFELIKDEEGKKKALNYDGLHTFQWSPKDNIIAAWILEKENNPARLVLVDIPSRKELQTRSKTQVEAQMHWQSEGDYLCLIVTKLSKAKKKGATNIEIFRMREKNIPVEGVEVKETVKGFYWETKGSRFAVLLTDESGHHPKLAFYALEKQKLECIYTFDLPSNSFNAMFWAPEGQYFVCAALGHGDLLWGALMQDNKFEVLHKDEHFMLTNVEWDPSSRYVMTSVTQPMSNEIGGFKYQMEAGYNIWTFQGRILYKEQKEKLFYIQWRPHPPSLMSDNELKNIRTNIKTFSKKYDSIDEKAKEAARQAYRQEREDKMNRFNAILERLRDYTGEKDEDSGWAEAREEVYFSQGWEMSESKTEEELEINEELIPS
mmetsp:Transcript_36181/g.84827  ORF Transcript_36181/g.84827 Transcript_36181/m.84827 type:complete len:709 (-) Transcript_36181:75-2201(-)